MSLWTLGGEITQVIRVRFIPFSLVPEGPERQLVMAALVAREHPQANHSGFTCGAAAESIEGEIFPGCNVERVTFTQTTHAEQNAIDTMVCSGHKLLRRVALVAAPRDRKIIIDRSDMPEKQPTMRDFPSWCGQCLVNVWENSGNDPNVELLSLRSDGILFLTTIGYAYPMAFEIQ